MGIFDEIKVAMTGIGEAKILTQDLRDFKRDDRIAIPI